MQKRTILNAENLKKKNKKKTKIIQIESKTKVTT